MNYKSVMKEYNLGPNGGILTSLNLFATKFDQVDALAAAAAPRQGGDTCRGGDLARASTFTSLAPCPGYGPL